MSNVLTLICDPEKRFLDRTHVSAGADAVRHAGGEPASPQWLAEGIAVDIPYTGADAPAVENAAREAFDGMLLDVAAQDETGRRKRLLLADMDSTIITVECIDELAHYAGKKAEIAAITERAMRGELEFETALRERIGMLIGLSAETLEQAFKERVRLTPGARTLVQTMASKGAVTALVSGGFTFFTERVADAAGFAEHRANRLIFEEGRLAGIAEPILGREAKLQTLDDLCRRHHVPHADALVVGDGANDLGMIGAAGLGVAYHAKPVVAQAAGARIDHGDLTALLYLQGYLSEQFVHD